MTEDITSAFQSPTDHVWTIEQGCDDQYVTAQYDVADGTYSLTYHPRACPVTTPCFTPAHAAIALREAGYSFPQISKILDGAYHLARNVG